MHTNHIQHPVLLGGKPTLQTSFTSWPIYDTQEEKEVKAVVKSGQWWGDHPVTSRFETSFAQFIETQWALAVTNGSHALEIILRALDIGPGDEVIVPAYTFIATATAVSMVGAIPILADIQDDTMTLEPEAVKKAITKRTKAIIHVHLAGIAGSIDEILSIAENSYLPVIEDCAHAHGAESRERRVGSLGIAGAFSFQGSKTLTSGEGGAIVTNNEMLYKKCWSIRNCGRLQGQPKYQHYELGSNYRITPFQSAILQVQLQRLTEQIKQRLNNARFLDRLLSQIEGITPQYRNPLDSAPGYLYIFYYQSEAFNNLSRSNFVKALQAEGIPCTEAAYPAIHQTHLFSKKLDRVNSKQNEKTASDYLLPEYAKLSFPNSEKIARETVWIPHQVLLGKQFQVLAVSTAIRKIKNHSSQLNTKLTKEEIAER